MKKMKEFFNKVIQYTQYHVIEYIKKHERLIKAVETIRGLYIYPNHMLGRRLKIKTKDVTTDVLVFAAHPDDDVLGVGTVLYRHSLKGENVQVVFVTNGTGRDNESWFIKTRNAKKKAEIRYKEAVEALSLIKINKENVHCLGFPDGGTHRYLQHISKDVLDVIEKINPKRIYVHSIEGGHVDHDLTSFVVRSVCNKIGFNNVFEWTEYNPIQPLGTEKVKFLSECPSEEINISITEEERRIKRKMLALHQSQDVEQFFHQGEAIRKADFSNLETELLKYIRISKRRLMPAIKQYRGIFMQLNLFIYIYSLCDWAF